MLPRSKVALAFLIALPILLVIPLRKAVEKRPRLWGVMSASISSLAVSHDGSVVAFQRGDGTFGLWTRVGEHRTLQPEGKAMAGTSSSVYAAVVYSPARFRFSADDKTLLTSNIRVADASTALYAWDVGTGRIKWSALSAYNDDFCRYWASPDGKRAAQRANSVVKVLDITGQGSEQNSKKSRFARTFPVLTRFQALVTEPKKPMSRLQTIALSTDGKTVVGVTMKGQLRFWDVATGTLQSQSTPALASSMADWELQYSPNDRFVALFDGDTLSIWDVAAHKWSSTTVSSNSEVALAWMPDSRSIWTGAGTVQQWGVPALKPLRELPVSGPVAVSGDGHTLITRALSSGSIPGGIWEWNIG